MRIKPSIHYEIQVVGPLSERWDGRMFGECLIQHQQGALTRLRVKVPDSAALRGLMNHLWDLNLEILSLQPIPADSITTDKENVDED